MTKENFRNREADLLEIRGYLLSLRTADGTPIVKSTNNTGFIGFVFCIQSLLNISRELLFHPSHPFKYVLGYKFSQDHLELFFNAVRGTLGWNNSPTAKDFSYIFRRFLAHVGVQPDSSGNCTNFSEETEADFSIIDHFSAVPDFYADSEFVENVVSYISGFVVRKVLKHEACVFCRLALIDTPTCQNRFFDHRHFIRLKNNGGLLLPSEAVVNVLRIVERLYRCLPDLMANKPQRIFVKLFDELPDNLFSSMHMIETNHRLKLIRSLLFAYCHLRSFHVARRMNTGRVTTRHRLTKCITFRSE